jgi:hypothetical protein
MNAVSATPMTHFFPTFGEAEVRRYQTERSPDEQRDLDQMFEVAEVLFPKLGHHVLSTSLYCWPHDPENKRITPVNKETLQQPHPSVKGNDSWWNVYLIPLLLSLDQVRSPWTVRIHLAPDLEFLIPVLKHPKVELRIMRHISTNTIPGMLWRYLPLEDDVILMARGTDTLWPDRVVQAAIPRMLSGPNALLRRFRPIDINGANFFVYRSIPGPILTKPGLGSGFTEAAKAWIWHQQRAYWPRHVDLPGADGEIFEAPKFAMSHWARYGQDEQLLSHWLYYRAAQKGIHSIIDASHQSGMWDRDWTYLQATNPQSVMEMI